jgi:hypothetical protein
MTHTIIHIPAGGVDPDKQPSIQEVESYTLQTLHYTDMQKLVGGYLETLSLAEGIDIWFNEEGRLTGLPLNRLITAASGAQFDILGDAFIAASTGEGETIGLTSEQAEHWLQVVQGWPVAILPGLTVRSV